MRREQGAMSLLVTGMLLVASLLTILGASRTAFYQIKRAQNEVGAAQAHWAAEGGLECAFTKAKIVNSVPVFSATECGLVDLDSVVFSGSPKVDVVATSGPTQVQRTFTALGSGRSSGVMKATSNLFLLGSVAMLADPGEPADENLWDCTMLRFKNDFIAHGNIINQGVGHGVTAPYADFPTPPTAPPQACSASHQTINGVGNYGYPTGLKNDVVNDTAFDPFKETFNYDRSEWLEVMYHDSVYRIGPSSLPPTKPSNKSSLPIAPVLNSSCGNKIKNAIGSGEDLIWVYGGCELDGADLVGIKTELSKASTPNSMVLVVHNGIFAVNGSHNLKGMVYHFVDDDLGFSPSSMHWNSVAPVIKAELLGALTGTAITIDNVSFFNNGAFNPSGGYVMDAEGTYAIYRGALHFLFNRDDIETPLEDFTTQINWIEGSWRDY
ncbi:hypothetical protein [Thaumasiovibrio sp. DFM-14]|uniref:hypothetical protein n=1 Tax=Thaumasiovibrio sp. DFM-14 TaxID=3384792 RepID=UPI0039A192D1